MYMPINPQKDRGFTLIELLLVVIVISVLSGAVLSIVNIGGMRMKARDSQRKSDIAKIQSALELYYTDNRVYPISASWINIGAASNALRTAIEGTYIDLLPNDPSYSQAVADPCYLDGGGTTATDYRYNYRTSATGSIYVITAIMENQGSDDDSRCASLTNWATLTCADGNSYNGTPDFCYGGQNPF